MANDTVARTSKTYDELAVEYITSGDIGAVNSVNARIAVRLFAVWLDKRPAPETSEVQHLRAIIDEVHAWIVCAAITTPGDLLGGGNAEHFVEITAPGYRAELKASERLAGCRNWKPKHGVGPYCGNCGFHENEHADLHR